MGQQRARASEAMGCWLLHCLGGAQGHGLSVQMEGRDGMPVAAAWRVHSLLCQREPDGKRLTAPWWGFPALQGKKARPWRESGSRALAFSRVLIMQKA